MSMKNPHEEKPNLRRVLRITGSLWFTGLLLLLLMVAMGSATVFETTRGTEQALGFFYRSPWFRLLLVLGAVNLLSALILRYPFKWRQSGFVMTHGGLLLLLGGALVSALFGVEGSLGLAEGESSKGFYRSRYTFTVTDLAKGMEVSRDLAAPLGHGLSRVNAPAVEPLSVGGLKAVEILEYLPDTIQRERILDDNDAPSPAVEISLSSNGKEDPTWCFPGTMARAGDRHAAFTILSDTESFDRLFEIKKERKVKGQGILQVKAGGRSFTLPLEEASREPRPLGDTGYTLRVLRYLSHAVVGAQGKVTNASERPVNPAVEVEITGPEGKENRLAFARFPDFKSMHDSATKMDVDVVFAMPVEDAPRAPVEVFRDPRGNLGVRFARQGAEVETRRLSVGEVVETPWPGQRFSVLRVLEHARRKAIPEPVTPPRKERSPALRVRWKGGKDSGELWLFMYRPRRVTAGGADYRFYFGDRLMPLDFTVTLNRFRIGYYPGRRRPRSFESHITIDDLNAGRKLDRVISMNHPVSYGGYTFYQSSYRMDSGRSVSYLSVSRDPGKLLSFAGYVITIAGMIVFLSLRAWERRRREAASTARNSP